MRSRDPAGDFDDSDAALDLSIVGDEEEQHRIELEHNLQDISLELSLSNPSQVGDRECSMERRDSRYRQTESSLEIEYPRHASRHRDVSIFPGQNSSYLDNTQLGRDDDSEFYSYRPTADDDAEVHYIGNTMSTAMHHASAVTLSAGLAGRNGKRIYAAESSLSGAEYDPDRPLDTVLNGVADELSLLNMDNTLTHGKRVTRNANNTQMQVAFEPRAGDSDLSAVHATTRRPKARNKQAQEHAASTQFDRDAIPRMKPRVKHSALNVHPPAPSTKANATGGSSTTTGSKFTRMAKSLAREIEASQRWVDVPELENRSPLKPLRNKENERRSPFRDVVNNIHTRHATSLPPRADTRSRRHDFKNLDARFVAPSKQDLSQSKILCLPDVTGLTSAVASPPRKDSKWRRYSGGSEGERVEDALNKTLTALQTRLNQLESQNLVSRRRIQELEFELETCKVEVKRERTRVMEREEIIVAQQKDFQKRHAALKRVAQNATELTNNARYKEAIEEKKALESLVTTLRTHLSRLTDELSNHQAQLDDLRSLRQSDFLHLQAKITEVDELRLEVERLAGEVDILRGVVEEGLNERRRAKASMSIVEKPAEVPHRAAAVNVSVRDESVNEVSGADFPSPPPSPPQFRQDDHATVRDKATSAGQKAGSSSRPESTSKARSRVKNEPRRTAEVEECPSDGLDLSQELGIHQADRDDGQACIAPNRMTRIGERPRIRKANLESPLPTRTRTRTAPQPTKPDHETGSPFPQIRGERLERMFFSAPDHNERTCRVCHRHRRPGASDDELDFPSWLPPRKRVKTGRDDGQAWGEACGLGNAAKLDDEAMAGRPGAHRAPFSEDRLPPQTVLARVLRELEDDFTHYKGIYIELADQYKIMDAASNVAKRNVLAEHLKEVINTLEQKGDQIASLYDLLSFRDKPTKESVVPDRKRSSRLPRSPRALRQTSGRHPEALRNRLTRL